MKFVVILVALWVSTVVWAQEESEAIPKELLDFRLDKQLALPAEAQLQPSIDPKNIQYLRRPKLKYPENIQSFGNIGDVELGVMVDKEGNVDRVHTLYSVHPELEQAAVAAMLQAKFKPLHIPFQIQQKMNFGHWSEKGGVEPYRVPKASKSLPEDLQYDEAPKIKIVAPVVYPFELLQSKTSGKAKVFIVIDDQGRVRKSGVVSATHPEFGFAAQASFQSWLFYPAKKQGKASWSVITREQKFNLTDRDSQQPKSAKRIQALLKQPTSSDIYTQSQLDRVPKILYQPLPKQITETGSKHVTIEFFVDQDGWVQLPRIVSTDHQEQAWLALIALKRWQFEVPTVDGKPVIAQLILPLQFQ